MRKYLPVFLFPVLLSVLSGMIFYLLLNSQNSLTPSISQAEASHRTRKVKFTPKPTKTPTPSPTRIPTRTPTPTKTPTPTLKAVTTPSTTVVTTTSIQGFIMNEINQYRTSHGLSEVKTDTHTCSFAKTRASEIVTSFSHNGFRDRINSKTLPYPSYSSITENIAMTSDYKQVVSMWKNSAGHAENMRKDTPFVCVEREGNYYAYEGWKP